MDTRIFSGEPLPIAPPPENPERGFFDRKLLDYLRRLMAKLSQVINNGLPFDATYWTKNDETANLPSSREVIAGANITLDYSVSGRVTVSASASTGGFAESFVGFFKSGDLTVTIADAGSSPIPFLIPWAAMHFNTAIFTHVVSSDEITIVLDGVYQFEFDVEHDDPKSNLDFWVEVKVGGTWYRVRHSILITNVTSFLPYVTYNLSVGFPIAAGTKVRLRGMPGDLIGALDPNGTCNLFRRSTRLSIIRIGDVKNGGTGGGDGWDGNPPTWTEAAP